jgi:hypothetical protein
MGDAEYLGLPPFSFLIKVNQQNAQYVSWQQLPKEAQFGCLREVLKRRCVMTAHHAPHPPLWRRIFSLPKTRLGWYSLGFLGAHALVMVALGIASGVLAAMGAPNLAGHPWLIAAVLFVSLSPALAGIATGLVAVIRRGERSILVVGPILFVVLFLLAEVLISH